MAMVTADLIRQGAEILMPVSHTAPYDLVARLNRRFYTVQVKFRAVGKTGTVDVKARRLTGVPGKDGGKYRYEDNLSYDILAIYADGVGCAYLNNESISKSITLRVIGEKKKCPAIKRFEDYGDVRDAL